MAARPPSSPSSAVRSARRLPLATFVLLSAGLAGGWWWAVAGTRASTSQRDRVLADQTALRISDWVHSRVALLHSVKNLVATGMLDTGPDWTSRITELIEPVGGFQAINWISADGVIQAIAPRDTNLPALGQRVIDHPIVGADVRAAIAHDRLVASRPLDLYQGGRGFTLYLPVRDHDGALLGIVNGVFRSDRLEQECVAELARSHHITLTDVDAPVVPDHNDFAPTSTTVTAQITIANRTWDLELSASPRQPGPLALAVLFIGFALIGGLTWLLRLALVRHAEATEAQAQRAEMAARLRSAERLEAMGHLAGGVAHDFNNLLTVIHGHADLMRVQLAADPPETTELAESVAAIRDASSRAAGVTSQLLAFARREPVTSGTVEVTSHLAALAPMLQNVATEGVTLALELPDTPAWAACPPTVLDRAVVNLVANAREAVRGSGHVRVRVTVTATHVVIEVSDDGHGMPPEVLRRAFEPFFTTRETGSGLGLATVYGLITQRGGTVDVASIVGQGTRFTIALPRIEPAEPRSDVSQAMGSLRATALRVILVEDDAAVRATLERALSREGILVTAFASGDAAIARAPPADVLVTDLVLPGADGVAVARALRGRQPDLRVIVISGYSDRPGSVDATLSAGARFLAKPFQLSELVATIHELAFEPAPEDAGPPPPPTSQTH